MRKPMEGLTPRQQATYDFILKAYRKDGIFPSVREIRDGIGVKSTATVQTHLVKLIEKGYLSRRGSLSRTWTILRKEDAPRMVYPGGSGQVEYDAGETVGIPLVGRVAAGEPILAEENREETVPMPAAYIRGESFMLRVHGDSMVNAGILDGDLVVVRCQKTAQNGEIVVAMVDGDATVKRFYKEKDCIRLQPENDAFEPILARDVEIAGKVIALLRTVI
ncbi:MAG: transcriptional repressor LexA [Actinomycetes bacterium]|nr:transcriptional repressor LexA [Actinomycetes bacterium]